MQNSLKGTFALTFLLLFLMVLTEIKYSRSEISYGDSVVENAFILFRPKMVINVV